MSHIWSQGYKNTCVFCVEIKYWESTTLWVSLSLSPLADSISPPEEIPPTNSPTIKNVPQLPQLQGQSRPTKRRRRETVMRRDTTSQLLPSVSNNYLILLSVIQGCYNPFCGKLRAQAQFGKNKIVNLWDGLLLHKLKITFNLLCFLQFSRNLDYKTTTIIVFFFSEIFEFTNVCFCNCVNCNYSFES